MLRALQLDFADWGQLSTDGPINLREFAKRESVEERFIGRALPLVFLAPDLIEAIVAGRLPSEWTTERLIRIKRLPLSWKAQRAMLGMA